MVRINGSILSYLVHAAESGDNFSAQRLRKWVHGLLHDVKSRKVPGFTTYLLHLCRF